jgi:dipeptidase E
MEICRKLIAIGGGEIREKSTLLIDQYIANLAYAHSEGKRPTAVFVGTASHDSLPYFNSFRKTYTPHFDIKADLILLTKKDIPMEKIVEKIEKANMIYIGGGDTLFMLDVWKSTGVDKLLIDAYNRCVPIAGLSAGAICWFEDMYTDSASSNLGSGEYSLCKGLGIIKALMSPHYDERAEFDNIAKSSESKICYAVENNASIVFENERPIKTLSSGGKAYVFRNGIKEELVL